MKFSLVLATVGRTQELQRFLEHLDKQSCRDFELIIVDQNPDDRLSPIVAPYTGRLPIVRCRSTTGLSVSRNVGLKHVSGDLVAFPDDDCWYPSDLLQKVSEALLAHPDLGGLTGRPIDPRSRSFDTSGGAVTRHNVFRRGISITIFLRRDVIACVGAFDESLGLGAESGKIGLEETDYLIRAISNSHRIHYFPDIIVFHTDSPLVYDASSALRQYGNGLAFGAVLRKHRYPFPFVLYCWLRPFAASSLSAITFRFAKAHYHLSALHGRVRGWFSN